MSELEARYERGQETRRMFGGGAIAAPGAMGDAWELAPDLERLLDEALFGSIWRRDALTATQREIITLSTFVVRGRNPQLAAVQGGGVVLHPPTGAILGGIGVSGVSAEDDEALARVGLETLGL